MRTTPDQDTLAAPLGSGPAGSAARLRRARLEPDVLRPRALHVVVDLVALALLLAVPGLATLVAVALQPPSAAAPVVTAVALTSAALAVLVAFAVVWPHHDGGRTPGMRRAGLRVVDRSGGIPSHARLLVRALAAPLDVVVGPWLVVLREDRRQLGDLLAGTQVVRDSSTRPVPAPRQGPAPAPRSRLRTRPPAGPRPQAGPVSR